MCVLLLVAPQLLKLIHQQCSYFSLHDDPKSVFSSLQNMDVKEKSPPTNIVDLPSSEAPHTYHNDTQAKTKQSRRAPSIT